MTYLPKIFVSIASYRDPECQHTVKDLFEKATHPERVSVGICWQAVPGEDDDCFTVKPPYPYQVRAKRYHAKDSKGCCWARVEAMSLHEGEEYTLQIDAHMRFAPGWDVTMIDMLARCLSPRAVLSGMPPGYQPPQQLQECGKSVSVAHVCMLGESDNIQPVWLSSFLRRRKELSPGPIPGAFIVGNFLFAPSEVFRDIPFDPHIFFRGQEPVYSARLWTHGWDLYQPDTVVIYHYWDSQVRGQDTYKKSNDRAKCSYQRVMHLLGVTTSDDPNVLTDVERYGMGKERTLAEYFEHAGIDLKNRVIFPSAKDGRWTRWQPKSFSLSSSVSVPLTRNETIAESKGTTMTARFQKPKA